MIKSERSPLYLAAAFIICVWGIYEAQSFLMPISLAALMTFLMTPAMRLFRRLKLPEFISVTLSALLLLLPLAGLVYLLVSQAQALLHDWPHLSASFQKAIAGFRSTEIAQKTHLAPMLDPQAFASRLNSNLGSGFKVAVESFARLLSAGSMLLVVLFFSVVMLVSRVHIKRSLDYLFSQYSEVSSVNTIEQMGALIEDFLIARMGIAVGVGTVGLAVAMAFGVPYAFILAVVFGLATWLPIIGFIVGILPILAVALAVGKSVAAVLTLTLILGVVWTIQDHILTPKLVGHRLKLNFLATYLVFFAGERLWGPWGMFLSVPMLGVLRIALSASPRLAPWAFLLGEETELPAAATASDSEPRRAA